MAGLPPEPQRQQQGVLPIPMAVQSSQMPDTIRSHYLHFRQTSLDLLFQDCLLSLSWHPSAHRHPAAQDVLTNPFLKPQQKHPVRMCDSSET